jgi:hypothetical protein
LNIPRYLANSNPAHTTRPKLNRYSYQQSIMRFSIALLAVSAGIVAAQSSTTTDAAAAVTPSSTAGAGPGVSEDDCDAAR